MAKKNGDFSSDIVGSIGKIEPLQLDLADECHAPARDLYSIGTREGCGELDVALNVDVRREDDVVILIEQLHGGADGVVRGRQRVAIQVEDGREDGRTRMTTLVWSGLDISE